MARVARAPAGISSATLDEAHANLAHTAATGAYALRGIGRIAPPFALAGAIVFMGRGLAGGEGLPALRAGVAARVAVERAGVALGLGVVTAIMSFVAAARLLRRAREFRAGLEQGIRTLDRPQGDV